MKIGIDASRNRSGGARAHLIGILHDSNPLLCGITEVHVWSYDSLLNALPDVPWLIKHEPPALKGSLLKQLFWQRFILPQEVKKYGCDILLNTDAGTVCPFHPAVTMSRDMLSYEKGEMNRFGLSFAWLRLLVLRYIQSNSLKRSTGAIFLTNYAAEVIQKHSGKIDEFRVIPHGVSANFRQNSSVDDWTDDTEHGPIRCLYVSNVALYKHQWHVALAIHMLRQRNYNVKILFAGGGDGEAQKMLDAVIAEVDPNCNFIEQIEFVSHSKVPSLLADADIFIFASSCENMPNTLVEAMSSGLPIACSNRGPMPEVLACGGEFFDPENPVTIANAVEKIISNKDYRIKIKKIAKELSEKYSWAKCGHDTWNYLKCVADKHHCSKK